jgi:hypothetical protein
MDLTVIPQADLPAVPGPIHIAPMSVLEIDNVRQLEALSLQRPQIAIDTDHVFHAGLYARTVMVPAGVVITGALIKIATLLIVNGDALVYVNGGAREVSGYNVITASAGRKQAFVAQSDTWLTMIFRSDAETMEQAEAEFTDEAEDLMSAGPMGENRVTVTGEKSWLA